ncbi:MAG: hypothetical protein WCX81_03815, partial [Monoglobales bacterium]
MKKALRIGYNRYYRDDIFDEHIKYIQENVSVIDEITLFAEFCHYGYWDLEYSKNNAEILKDRIKRYKSAGVKSVGINLLGTIGHLEEGWDVLSKADLQYRVFPDGRVSKGQLCIANQSYLEYVFARYSMYADTGADFIWMDDDIRINSYGCLCDGCIDRFNKLLGTNYSRGKLAELLDTDTTVKKAWMDLNFDDIITLVRTVKAAVKKVNPDIKIGYMSIGGNDVVEWISASGAVKGRPGGGFYDERCPLSVFDKCLGVQSQISVYPDEVKDIQYEYEAFNYQTLNRSVRFSELESTLALMNGCNGILYNNDIFYDRHQLPKMLSSSARKWDILTKNNSLCKPAGVYCVGISTAKILNEIGIPVTYYPDNAVAVFVTGDGLNRLTDEKIKDLLNRNLLTDGKGVEILCERGFSEFCGGKIENVYDNGMAERFGNHWLNGEYRNYYRDVFMSFKYYVNNSGNAYEFKLSAGSECISNLETITHKKLGCSLYVFENKQGAKFAADGYLFPNSL